MKYITWYINDKGNVETYESNTAHRAVRLAFNIFAGIPWEDVKKYAILAEYWPGVIVPVKLKIFVSDITKKVRYDLFNKVTGEKIETVETEYRKLSEMLP